MSLSLGIDLASLPVHYLLTRAAASGGKGGQPPPEVLSRTNQVKSVDGFVIFRLIGEDTDPPPPPPPYKFRAFGSRDNAPRSPRDKKNLATALLTWRKENLQRPSSLTIRKP